MAVLLVLACSSRGQSQIVRGTIVDESTNAPLSGVFVVLLDSVGRMRGGTLTDQKGFYAMRAPHAGSFALRAERIGHRSTTTAPVVLSDAQASSVDIRVPVAAIALAPIDVRGAKRCEVRAEQGRRTAQLWEEARKALTVTQWVKTARPIQFESRTYTRELDPYSLEVRTESTRHTSSTAIPYRAVSPDSLARFGFVQEDGDAVVYYGPDADVLLSDIFLEQHCFRAVNGSGDRDSLVGLAFEPVRERELRDITGTLWLDAKTFELRFLEYRYTNQPRRFQNIRALGGRTEFRKLSNGAWIVERWYIRMPITGVSATRDVFVNALREEGGEVLRISDPQVTVQLSNDGAVRGTVYDSLRGQPLANATVYLSGTSHRAVTDAQGSYTLLNVPEGRYVIAFTHPLLDSLPSFPLPRLVQVQPKDTAREMLAVPSVQAQLRDKCGTSASGGALFGYVRDLQGNVITHAEVFVEHKRYAQPNSARLDVSTERSSARTDNTGRYSICSLPLNQPIKVWVAANELRSKESTVHIANQPFKRVDLVLR